MLRGRLTPPWQGTPQLQVKIELKFGGNEENGEVFIHKEKLPQVRVVDPNVLLDEVDTSQHRDPVHPPSAFYAKLAVKVTAMLEGEAVETGSGTRDSRPEPDPKRIRLVSSGGNRGRPFQRGRGGGGGCRGGHRGGRGRRGF